MNYAYVQRSLGAAFRLAVRDQRAWEEFDLSTSGFFRSFAAFLLVIPLNTVFDLFALRLAEANAAPGEETAGLMQYGVAEFIFSTVTLGIEWLLFPLVLIPLVMFLGLSGRYAQMVIAHNWGRVIIELLNVPAIILFSLGLVSHQFAIDLLFLSLGVSLYYRFYIAQTALGVGWGLAIAIAILELLISIFFALAVSSTAGLWLPATP